MQQFFHAITDPFFTLGGFLHWGNFFIALVISVIIFLLMHKRSGLAGSPSIVEYLFPRKVFLHPSSIVDYQYYFVIKLVVVFCVYPFIGVIREEVDGLANNILYIIEATHPVWLVPEKVGVIAYAIITFLVLDFSLFFAHWLMHKVPFFWEFHKVHHSANVLNPITVLRMHPVDFILNSFVITINMSLVYVLWVWLFGQTYPSITVLGASLFAILIYSGDALLRHSHVWLSYGHKVEKLLLSPAQHQIHHSAKAIHVDKNMGLRLAIWDLIFGTLYTTSPKYKESFRMGLRHHECREFTNVWKCLFLPIKKLFNK